MSKVRKCGNCMNRAYTSWDMIDFCYGYEVAENEQDEIRNAADCPRYEEGTPYCLRKDEYCPSATAGDYSPSCPWNAPGMSVRDFI